MKKVLTLALALVMVLCFAACGNKTPEAEGTMTQIANPWAEVDADTISEKLNGFAFGCPEIAENVVYMWNEAIGLAEMSFEYEGSMWVARAQFVEEFTDISGDYTVWDDTVDSYALGSISGKEYYTATEDGFNGLGLWFDEEYGIMYSLDYGRAAEQYDLSFANQIFPSEN